MAVFDVQHRLQFREDGQGQGHESYLVKARHLHNVIRTGDSRLLLNKTPGSFSFQDSKTELPHDLWLFFTLI